MNRFAALGLIAVSVMSATALPQISYAQATYTGRVERVWEDGFRLNIGNGRTLTVDSWDIYGDNTPRHVAVGARLRVTGEFEGGEFDASSIAKQSGR